MQQGGVSKNMQSDCLVGTSVCLQHKLPVGPQIGISCAPLIPVVRLAPPLREARDITEKVTGTARMCVSP